MRRISNVVLGLLLMSGSAIHADSLTHISTFEWPNDTIVGLSGLEISEDGETFVAVGDQGWFINGRLVRTGGQVSGLEDLQYHPILGLNGLPVAARRLPDHSDSEGLAIAPDGQIWVSFERWARVSSFTDFDSTARWTQDHPSFSDYRENRQLEALALQPDGTLYTFPEKPLRDGFPIYQLKDGFWEISDYIEQQNGFSIVGADFDANGDLYLLERKLVLGLWWQNRVRRMRVSAPDEIEILWTGSRGAFFNLEGIAVWRDEVGLRLTVVSDNNADVSEPTQFVEFRLNQDPN